MIVKMPPQQLLLSWKDHNGALVVVFENLLRHNTLVDCTLAAEGQYLKAHKVVLSACSSYFELLFSQESEKNPIVILKDVKFQELEAAVNFMYRGEVEVCEDRLAAFLEVADSLQIKGLGSEARKQDLQGKSPSLKSLNFAVPPKSHSRKEVSHTQSENTKEISIIQDSDKKNNESFSHNQLPRRETLRSSPIPSSFAIPSSFSIASASTSCSVGAESHYGRDKLENNQRSSPSVSVFPSGDTVPSDVNTMIKTEPVTEVYLDENSDEMERDFDDVTMMEDQEDWGDPNIESMGDDQVTNPHDPGYSVDHIKTEEASLERVSGEPPMGHISSEDAVWQHGSAGSGEGPHFASVFFKEQRLDVEPGPGPGPAPGPAPGPVPGNGTGTSSAPSRQGGARTGTARVGAATVALRGGRFQCSHCGYVTNKTSNWARHQRVHTGEKPHKCPFCAFTTQHDSTLKVHMQSHNGEKPYKCTVCSYATTRVDSLKLHMRVHTGEKPFKCTVCSYATTQSYSLKLHMRTHNGEKPYTCTICSYTTSRVDSLKSHMRTHTGDKPCVF